MTTTDPDLDTAGPTAAGTGDVPPAGGTAAPGSAAPPPSRPRRRRRRGWAALGRLGLVVVLLAVAVAASAVLVVSTRENPATGLGPAADIGALQVASLEADDPVNALSPSSTAIGPPRWPPGSTSPPAAVPGDHQVQLGGGDRAGEHPQVRGQRPGTTHLDHLQPRPGRGLVDVERTVVGGEVGRARRPQRGHPPAPASREPPVKPGRRNRRLPEGLVQARRHRGSRSPAPC